MKLCVIETCLRERRKNRRHCSVHSSRISKGLPLDGPMPLEHDPRIRFWLYVEQVGDCWEWQGALDPNGYGRWNSKSTSLAHRYAYELMIIQVPDGLVLDHLCRNPRCVNPWHLEPVTNAVNVQRGISGQRQRARTACPKGHPYDDANTYILPGSGSRCCRECKRIESRLRGRRSRAQWAS